MSLIIEPAKQPELMAKLQMISLVSALTMEVGFNMKLSRNIHGLKIAQSLGYEGSRKAGALQWAVKQLQDQDPNYRVPDSTAKILATL